MEASQEARNNRKYEREKVKTPRKKKTPAKNRGRKLSEKKIYFHIFTVANSIKVIISLLYLVNDGGEEQN